MPSRSSDSARRSPMPFRNLTGVSSRTTAAAPGDIVRLSGLDRGFHEEILGKPVGIERLEILDRLPEADETYGERQLTPDRRDRATACAAVKLGHNDACRRHGLGEEFPLLNGVLSHG